MKIYAMLHNFSSITHSFRFSLPSIAIKKVSKNEPSKVPRKFPNKFLSKYRKRFDENLGSNNCLVLAEFSL